jgi:hypothetical protein
LTKVETTAACRGRNVKRYLMMTTRNTRGLTMSNYARKLINQTAHTMLEAWAIGGEACALDTAERLARETCETEGQAAWLIEHATAAYRDLQQHHYV